VICSVVAAQAGMGSGPFGAAYLLAVAAARATTLAR